MACGLVSFEAAVNIIMVDATVVFSWGDFSNITHIVTGPSATFGIRPLPSLGREGLLCGFACQYWSSEAEDGHAGLLNGAAVRAPSGPHYGGEGGCRSVFCSGVPCSYSLRQLLLELMAASKAPSGAVALSAIAAPACRNKAEASASKGRVMSAGSNAATANVIAILSKALLLAFDRGPGWDSIGPRLIIRMALMAVVSGVPGGGGVGVGGAGAGRMKRTRVEAAANGAHDGCGGGEGECGSAGTEYDLLLMEALTQAVCTAAGKVDSAPLAASVLQVCVLMCMKQNKGMAR